ncbi:MAG TPA: hypothetical protein VGQ76_19625 [Thermoanaerobaculia bacterium]|nr:hypothetical protein [Thermoanaerobaculia bacterium]
MRNRNARCSYVVAVEPTGETHDLRELGLYLSTLSVAGCDVIVIDASPRPLFETHHRVLRWVARHVTVGAEHCTPGGFFDPVRAASAVAACEKVIVASPDVRYTPDAIDRLCNLLDLHEVVEPQDYLEPLPWWGSIDAGRILVHRGIEPRPDHGATFGFRRTAIHSLRILGSSDITDDPARRLASAGAEVFAAANVFVRREPGAFDAWLEERPRAANEDFSLPMKSAFFFSLVPLLLLLILLGEPRLAGVYAGVVAFSSVGLAFRGRIGASAFFPLRACLFAPLWVFERSISVYWALFRRLRGVEAEHRRVAIAPAHTSDKRERSVSY